MKNFKLSLREAKFVEEYLRNRFNASRAYSVSHSQPDSNISKSGGSALLKKQNIKNAINNSEEGYRAMARRMKLDRRNILKELRTVIKTGTAREKISGIDLLAKLCGFYKEKSEITIDFETKPKVDTSKMSQDEIIELQNKLFASL